MPRVAMGWVGAAALALVFAACAGDRDLPGGADGGNGCTNAGAATLDEVYAKYLDQKVATGCNANGCHGTGAGGLTFHNARELWDATVNKPSLERPQMKLVAPGDLANSYLYWKMHPSEPLRMPQGGPYLDDAALAEVAAWICSGAAPPSEQGPDGGTPDAGTTEDAGVPGPEILKLEPTSGTIGTQVTITGSGFGPSTEEVAVAFHGTPAVVSTHGEDFITTQVPAGATSGPVTVTVGGLTATSADEFQIIVLNPAPVLAGVSPNALSTGAAETTLALSGSSFVAKSTAEWDGTALATSFVSDTKVTATVPAALLAQAGAHTVTVTTPGPGGGTSAGLPVQVDNPAPHVSSFTPSAVEAGSGAVTLRVSGSGFIPASQVQLNGATAASTFVGPADLDVPLAASLLAAAGQLSVTVVNPAPGGGASAAAAFPIVNPKPAIASVSPSGVAAGSGATTLTIDGNGFISSSIVNLDGAALATTFVSAIRLTAGVSDAEVSVGGAHLLTIVNPGPGGGASAAQAWNVTNPQPAISGISPTSVATGGAAFTLTVTGSGFVPVSVVSFNGNAVSTSFVDANTLTAQIPTIAGPGSYPVVVTNPAPGGGASTAATLTAAVTSGPSITGISPNTAAANTTFDLTVTGSGFACSGPNKSVILIGTSTISAGSCSSTSLVAAVGPLSAGSYSVKVKNNTLTSSALTLDVVAPNPVPTLAALSPTSAAAGSSGATITVTGSGFVSGAVVSFNGAARTTTFVSATQLTASLLAGDFANAGVFQVIATNPAPGGGASNALSFTVEAANPVPTISGLTPASVAAGAGATTVTIAGTGFVSGSQANFDGAARTTTFVSSSSVKMALSASDTQSSGTHAITVTNPAPGGGTSGSFTFSVVAQNPVPVLSTLSPTSALAGTSGFTLTVSGSSFVSGATVSFNGVAKATTFVSASQLTASVSSSDIASAGTATVQVTNPAPGGGASGTMSFAINNPAPAITSISPSTATVGGPAFSLTINGSGFVSGSSVKLDGSARTAHYVNSTQLTADILQADIAATGTHTITVENAAPGGGTSAGVTLTVSSQPNPVPSVTALSPCGIVAGKGSFTLTINGTGFVNGATAKFNGTAVTVTFVSATQLTAAIPGSLVTTAPSGDAAPVIVSNPSPGGGAAPTVYLGVASKASTLSGNAQAVLSPNCATSQCHSGSLPAGNLDLSSGKAYAQLVNVPADECSTRKRVVACGPLDTQSYLVAKILGSNMCSGSAMPKGAPLTATEKQTLIDWIAQGAPQ